MTAKPWGKWFWSDYLADPGVRASSLLARGLWMDIISYIALNTLGRPGHLEVNGRPVTDAELPNLVGSASDLVAAALAELERNRVFDRASDGTIVCRRIARDAKRRRVAAENGRRGGEAKSRKDKGNPSLLYQSPSKNGGNASTKEAGEIVADPTVFASEKTWPTLGPEARSQKPDERAAAAADARDPAEPASSGEPNRLLDLTDRIIDAAGVDPSKSPTWMTAGMEVSKWVRAGYDPDLDILPAVKFVMARRQNSPPDSPRYFLKAIAEHHHNRTAGLPEIVIDQHRQETIHVAAQPARPTFDRFAAEDARRERGRRHLASMVGPVGPRDGAADGGYD